MLEVGDELTINNDILSQSIINLKLLIEFTQQKMSQDKHGQEKFWYAQRTATIFHEGIS